MFRPENWATAFVNAAGNPDAAEEALQYLKVFCNAALSLPGDLSGTNDADRLGKAIHAARGRLPGGNAAQNSFCLAERFVQLMLRRDCFHHHKKIIRNIEKMTDKQKGIEEIIVEAAVNLEKDFLDTIKETARGLTGAKEIKLSFRLIPELIGGLRLRRGSILYDGSIKRSLEKMALGLKTQGI